MCPLYLSLFHFKFSMGFPESGSKADIFFSLFTSDRERGIEMRMRKTKFHFFLTQQCLHARLSVDTGDKVLLSVQQ